MGALNETLEKFNNGEQRYEEDQNFKEAVDSLAAKIGVYAVLDKTLNQLRVLRGIHAKTIEQNKQLVDEADIEKGSLFRSIHNLSAENERLADEVENLKASNRTLIENNIRLTERLLDYESE